MISEQVNSVWECKNCQAVFQSKDQIRANPDCCKNPELVLLAYSPELEKKARIEFGECYEKIISFIDYYMDMPKDYAKLTAIWILGTYLHKSFESYPYLFINAMRGSGKTRLLKIISHLASGSNGEVHSGLTEAVFFRIPPHRTLVIDEFENVGSKNKADLREYLNASYKKGGIVQRMKKVKDKDGEGYKTESFEPFKPVVMANIWGMDEVLGDRCISFILEKSNNPSKTKKLENFTNNQTILDIKRTLDAISMSLCHVMSQKNNINAWNNYIDNRYNDITTYTTLTTLTTLTTQQIEDDEVLLKIDNSGIEGRNLELLFPLLNVARILNDEVFEDILRIGSKIMVNKKEDELAESKDVSVIEFVSQLNPSYQIDFIYLNELLRKYIEYTGETDSEDKWLNAKWFGKSLKRLGLIIDKRRKTKGREITLNISKAKENLKMFQRKDE